MKNLIFSAFLLLVVLCTAASFAGCADVDDDGFDTLSSPEAAAISSPAPAAVNQKNEIPETDNKTTEEKSSDPSLPPDLVPPGTDPDPESIPKADQSDVGKTKTLILGTEIKYFIYVRNVNTSEELLTVLVDSEIDHKADTAPVVVYSVNFGGVNGLIDSIGKEVSGTVVSVTNISAYESFYFHGMCFFINTADVSEDVVDMTNPADNPNDIQIYFSQNKNHDDTTDFDGLMGNQTNVMSKYFEDRIKVMDRISGRFGFRYK